MARTSTKKPSFQFYPGDWKKDPALCMCGLATRAVWLELLCAMHEFGEGEVSGTLSQLARLCGCLPTEMAAALQELAATEAAEVDNFPCDISVTCHADVTGSHAVVTVISRRLSREAGETVKARKRKQLQREREALSQAGPADVTEKSRPPSSSSSSASLKEPPSSPPGGTPDEGLSDDPRFEIGATPVRRGYGTPRPGAGEAAKALERHRQTNLGMATPSNMLSAFVTRIARMMDQNRVSADRVRKVAEWLADGGDTGPLTVDDANRFCQHFASLEADMRRGQSGGAATRTSRTYGEPTMAELMAQRNTAFTVDEEDAP